VRTRDHDYRAMVGALAEATRRRDAELHIADQAYRETTAQAAAELARAEADAANADRRAGAAAGQVLAVDREAGRLWEQLDRARGLRIRGLGELPEPVRAEVLPQAARPHPTDGIAPPQVLLARAAIRIAETIRPAGRRSLPRWALPLLPLFGALIAALAGLTAAGLVTFGSTGFWGGSVIRGLGWLTFVAAPSAGVPVAALIAHRRLEARLGIGGIGCTLLGGMVSATLLSLAFAAAY
jgi:hypothetical protein